MVTTLGQSGTIVNGVVDRSTCAVTMQFEHGAGVQELTATARGREFMEVQSVAPITFSFGPMDVLRVRNP